MEKLLQTSEESKRLLEIQQRLAETSIDFAFSAKQVMSFVDEIGKLTDHELVHGPIGEEEVVGFLELFGRNHPRPNIAGVQVEKVVAVLQGEKWRKIAEEQQTSQASIGKARLSAITLIAQELNAIDNPPRMLGRFSLDCIESFVDEINHEAGKPLITLPVSEEELESYIEIYGRKNRSTATVGLQIDRLMMLLEGRSLADVADEQFLNESALRRMRAGAVKIIAKELRVLYGEVELPLEEKKVKAPSSKKKRLRAVNVKTSRKPSNKPLKHTPPVLPESSELPQDTGKEKLRLPYDVEILADTQISVELGTERSGERAQLETAINRLVYDKMISPEGGRLFKYHLGMIKLQEYGVGERNLLLATCEYLRKLLKDNSQLRYSLDEVPALSRVTQRLLGSRNDARDPVSRNELVKRYLEVEKNGERVFKTVADCEKFVDGAILVDFQRGLSIEG